MPHQCLKCGKTYEESHFVLEGCPECGGQSFYYTKKPLGDEKRKQLLEEIQKEEHIKGERIEDIVETLRKRKEEAIREVEKFKEKVESISVKEEGDYEINVKRLIEEGSIIVYRDGAYFIYLPSLFKGKK
jgi:predicted  nucleic acid-binding Zn-ribbon protein